MVNTRFYIFCKIIIIKIKIFNFSINSKHFTYPWGPPRIKIWGGTSDNINIRVQYIQYTVCRGDARILVWGNIRKNFIHEFLSSPLLQWRLQDFGWEKTFSTNLLIKDF